MIDFATPPVLLDETQRLAALRALAVLDTPPDPALDVITRLAADRFDTEIALISLVDEHRQWFKSRHGLDACETSRADSFCAHSITSDDVMVVPDATADPRFAANPLVMREQLMLAQRQEAVGQLASGIAHDFNNLIAAIAGTASLLEGVADDHVRRHALRIQSAAQTATGLVDKLLALGRRAPDLKLVDLRAILASVRDLVAPSLADAQHRIEVDLPPAPVLARADDTEVMQVILNLALNARDALPGGKDGRIAISLLDAADHQPAGDVLVGSLPTGPAALIRVSDTGCGIDPDDLAQVFEPFYTRKGDAGTGLGLAVVAGIVDNAGGAIALFSRLGEGAVFEVWWPLQSAVSEQPSHSIVEAADADVLAGKAVLVVDDNPAVVDTLVAMLEQAGAEPGPCLDSADALAAVVEDPQAWSLVITDYDMPGLNGAALARQLRDIRADLPLLLLSALPRAHQRRTGEAELFDAVLGKPASMDALVAAARTAIAAARKRTV